MGEIDIAAELRRDNPTIRAVEIDVYADALRTYYEASRNVAKNGAICAHPRTGVPMENPYLKIRAAQGALLAKMRGVKSDRVVGLLAAEVAV